MRQNSGVTVSAAQASAFYREVLRDGQVWGIRDENGFPSPVNTDGFRAMPFWSLRSRAERVIATVEAYAGFEPVPIGLDEFRTRWLPGLVGDALLVGLNWSGERPTGYDVAPADVEARFVSMEAAAAPVASADRSSDSRPQ